MRKISEEVRAQVMLLTQIGQSVPQISKHLNVSGSTVSRVRRELNATVAATMDSKAEEAFDVACIITYLHETYEEDILRVAMFHKYVDESVSQEASGNPQPMAQLDTLMSCYAVDCLNKKCETYSWFPTAAMYFHRQVSKQLMAEVTKSLTEHMTTLDTLAELRSKQQ